MHFSSFFLLIINKKPYLCTIFGKKVQNTYFIYLDERNYKRGQVA